MRQLLSLSVVAAALACKADPSVEGTDSGSTPSDAVSVFPPSGWVDVAPLATVEVTWPEAIDTLEGATITLVDAAGRDLPFTPSIVGDRTLVIDPDAPFVSEATITASVDGVALASGDPGESVTTTFEVHPSLEIATTESLTSYSVYLYDDDDVHLGIEYYSDPGLDLVYGTADDVRSGFLRYDIDEQGEVTGGTLVVAPGPDNTLDTSDDERLYYFTRSSTADSETYLYYNAGPDTLWFTSDDVVDNVTRLFYDDLGRQVRRIDSRGLGADGEPLTFDDDDLNSTLTSFGAYGELRTIRFQGFGDDQVAYTEDDPVERYWDRSYDANGNQIALRFFGGPGADSIWYSADDVMTSHQRREFDERNLAVSWTFYEETGPDGEWLTSDDPVDRYQAFVYDANGLLIQDATSSGRGFDGEWITPDDNLDDYETFAYDADGHRTERRSTRNAGLDGLWFTTDDELGSTFRYRAPRAARSGSSRR